MFLDELFEVIEEPAPKEFHLPKSTYTSKRRESASKTSFTKKASTHFDYKARSWSENQFPPRKLEKRIKKPRGCHQNVTIVVKDELDRFELEERNRILENEKKISELKLAIKDKELEDTDDECSWSKETLLSDTVTSENFSEFSDVEEKKKIDQGTQFEDISPPIYQTKKIIEASKLGESQEVIQKIEYHEKAEMIKADDGLIDEELTTLNIIRHCYQKKKSFHELYRKNDYEVEDSSSQTDSEEIVCCESSESQMIVPESRKITDVDPDWSGKQTVSILSSACDVKMRAYLNGNGERVICYSLCIQHRNPMEKIAWNMHQLKEIPSEPEILQKTEIGIADVAEFRFIARFPFVGMLTALKVSRGILVDEKVTQTEDDLADNASFADNVSFADAQSVISRNDSELEEIEEIADAQSIISRNDSEWEEIPDVVYEVSFEGEWDTSDDDVGRNVRAICCNLDSD